MKKIIPTIIVSMMLMSFCYVFSIEESMQLSSLSTFFENKQYHRVTFHLENEFLKKYPDNAQGWLLLGHAQNKISNNEKAVISYQKAIDIEPNLERAYLGLGIAHRNLENYNVALSYYLKCIYLNPVNAEAFSGLSIIELKNQNYSSALSYAMKSYELDSTSPVAAANLSLCYHFNNNILERDYYLSKADQNGYNNKEQLQKLFVKDLFALKSK